MILFMEIIRSPDDKQLLAAFAASDKKASRFYNARQLEKLRKNPAQKELPEDSVKNGLELLVLAQLAVSCGAKSLTRDFRSTRDVAEAGNLLIVSPQRGFYLCNL
jgi:hypothetical protein